MRNFTLLLLLTILFRWDSIAQNDYSLNFDGTNDYVEIIPNAVYNTVTDSFSICAWIRPETVIPGPEGAAIVARRDYVGGASPERTHFMFTVLDGLGLRFMSNNSTNGALYSTNAVTADSVVTLNEWNFVVVTFYKGYVEMYVNGSIVYSNNFGNKELFPYFHVINFGRVHRISQGNFFSEFDGKIDEVSMWHDNLTASEIAQYYICPPIGNEANLLGYYKFEEGSGLITSDETFNNSSGDLLLGASYNTDVPNRFCHCGFNSVDTLNPVVCDAYISPLGMLHNVTSTFNDTLPNALGCDSIITIYLTVNNSSTIYDTVSACDLAVINGNTYTSSKNVTDSLLSVSGCDSTIITNLTINLSASTIIDTSIASGGSIFVGGANQTTTGTYYDTLMASNGCDSIVTTNLTILTGLSSYLTDRIKVYPNPVSSTLFVETPLYTTIEFYTVEGRRLKEVVGNIGQDQIDISMLPSGVYFMRLITSEGTKPVKLVKQ